MELERYRLCAEAAKKNAKAELVLKNANVVNVFTGEVIKGDVAIAEGIVVGVGQFEGIEERDMEGKYLCPGFIDSHLHLESTLVTPSELIGQAVQCGTTTYIVDPHESANVSGAAGIDYILEQTENVEANVYVMMPSCVPSTEFDDNGCEFTADKMKPYLDHPRILGLGEVMDYVSVVSGDARMHEKLELFQGRTLDGHAPGLGDEDMAAYAMAGIATDHECTDFDYALKERRLGMQILIREGSAARNLEAIVKGIVEHGISTEGFCFCTDDKHIEEIQKDGHINYNVKKAVELGIPAVQAIQMATVNAAKCYGLRHIGAIAPGYQADIVVLDDLCSMNVSEVFFKGRKVGRNELDKRRECPSGLKHTIHLKNFSKECLKLPLQGKRAHVIQMEEGQITTKDLVCRVPGEKEFEANGEFNKIAVIERHKGTGRTGVGILAGFGLHGGAIASSVSHDSHNIIVVGDNDEDMELAVNELVRTQGGYTIVENGAVSMTLALPIMGLMSDAGYENVNAMLKKMLVKAHQMGVPEAMEPFITLSFMALPVIPELRITPRGLFSVSEFCLLDTIRNGEDNGN